MLGQEQHHNRNRVQKKMNNSSSHNLHVFEKRGEKTLKCGLFKSLTDVTEGYCGYTKKATCLSCYQGMLKSHIYANF